MDDFPSLLWVDDDAGGLLRPLLRLFASTGLAVHTASDVTTAESLLSEITFNAVLLDLILPAAYGKRGLSAYRGLTLAEEIRRGKYWNLDTHVGTPPTTRLVILSVAPYESEVATASQHLSLRYFNKAALLEPGVIDQLLSALLPTPG
jgi:ActR/RegA family two-component response regulator